MKFICGETYNNQTKHISENYQNCGIYNNYRRLEKRVVIPITILVYGVIGWVASRDNLSIIFDFFHIEQNNIGVAVLCLMWTVLLANIVTIILHEFIHLKALPTKIEEAVIVFNLPFAISLEHCTWLTKKGKLIILITPVVVLTLIIIIFILLTGYLFLGICLLTFNLILSASDIYSFFFIFFKLPTNVFMFGNYYRCQRWKLSLCI